MLNKFKIISYFILLLFFVFFIILTYFSDLNKKKIIENRSNLSNNFTQKTNDIPYLKNDTYKIIEYFPSNPKKDKIKKRHYWNLLKKNNE